MGGAACVALAGRTSVMADGFQKMQRRTGIQIQVFRRL